MTSKRRVLVAFAGWEDRFASGVKKNLSQFGDLDNVCVFYFLEFSSMTEASRRTVKEHCDSVEFVELRAEDPVYSWRVSVKKVQQLADGPVDLLVDFSTMPREIVWYILWAAHQVKANVRCLYYSPAEYGGDWLSRDPHAPRMVFKLSGVADPSRSTALLVTAGYDTQRVWRLINWCEPDRLMVGIQEGERFRRNTDIMRSAEEEFGKKLGCSVFKVNAFGDRFGEDEIAQQVDGVVRTHNVVLASMGPKLTALSLYRVQRRYENVGLVYAPAGQYNHEYSRGIGDFYSCCMGDGDD